MTPPARSPFSSDPNDPPFWPVGQMFIEKVERLAVLSPQKTQALHAIVDSVLRETWWQTARTPDGLQQLLALSGDCDRAKGGPR